MSKKANHTTLIVSIITSDVTMEYAYFLFLNVIWKMIVLMVATRIIVYQIAVTHYLIKLLCSPTYNHMKTNIWILKYRCLFYAMEFIQM